MTNTRITDATDSDNVTAGEACERVLWTESVPQQRHVCQLRLTSLLPLYLFDAAPRQSASRRPLRAAVTVRLDAVSRPCDVCGRW